jgi:predicted RNA-binding protein YlxR (DUF448 family)
MSATVAETELDRGPAAGDERFCALERRVKPVDELIRFVVGPGNDVVADVKRKLPGRGLWITASRAAVDEAVKKAVFARGFRKDLRVAADLAAQTERLLERSALDALAIAAKAGRVLSGFAKVESAIGDDELAALIHAREAAEDGKRKLNTALRRNIAETAQVPLIEAFSGEHLDLALGRVNVIHAALLGGPVSTTFLARTKRLLRFRDGNPGAAATPTTAPSHELRTE